MQKMTNIRFSLEKVAEIFNPDLFDLNEVAAGDTVTALFEICEEDLDSYCSYMAQVECRSDSDSRWITGVLVSELEAWNEFGEKEELPFTSRNLEDAIEENNFNL